MKLTLNPDALAVESFDVAGNAGQWTAGVYAENLLLSETQITRPATACCTTTRL